MTPDKFVEYASFVTMPPWAISVKRNIEGVDGLPIPVEDQTVQIVIKRFIGDGDKQQEIRRRRTIEPILINDAVMFNDRLSVVKFVQEFVKESQALIDSGEVECAHRA